MTSTLTTGCLAKCLSKWHNILIIEKTDERIVPKFVINVSQKLHNQKDVNCMILITTQCWYGYDKIKAFDYWSIAFPPCWLIHVTQYSTLDLNASSSLSFMVAPHLNLLHTLGPNDPIVGAQWLAHYITAKASVDHLCVESPCVTVGSRQLVLLPPVNRREGEWLSITGKMLQ